MALPHFLTKSKRIRPETTRINAAAQEYRPLLGSWLIKLALMLNWHEAERDERLPAVFRNNEFMALTGLSEKSELRSRKAPTALQCRSMLQAQLKVIEKEELSPELPLFRNLEFFSEILDMDEADQAILLFTALLDLFPVFRDVISDRFEKTSDLTLCRILVGLTGVIESKFHEAIGSSGILTTTGLIKVDHRVVDLEGKVDLIKGLSGIFLSHNADSVELMGRFLRKASPPTLTLANFPHLSADTEALAPYLRNALAQETVGVNILLTGRPGVGKTEYAQALAAELGAELYEIAYAGTDGEPIRGESRLRAYSFCQRLLRRNRKAILMFDEVEDVFPSDFGLFSLLFGGDSLDSGGKSGGKAWINRTMEQNPVPAIWISNRTSQIDQAYRRRFDYSVTFPIPPKKVRLSIAEHHLGCFEPTRQWLDRIAVNDELTPAQLERAAKVARIAAAGDNELARDLVDQTLERSISLLDQKRTPVRSRVWTGYDIAWLNTDTSISRIIEGLRRRPHGTFCFYGAAGTGKSELARHIADEIGVPFIVRRASDLLDKYVGESEKNIAAMFNEARQQNALLVLDEADSFLADRRSARQSWEVTQVNELLTQMEAFDGIFICTTNLMEKLDQASLRRFAFKVRFDPLTPDQRWGLFRQELERLGGKKTDIDQWESQVRRLEKLTPGDVAVAVRQFELWGITASAGELCEQLRRECEAKGATPGRIGFGS